MLVKTKHFGEIELGEDKILTFPCGILGFEECKKYTILFDCEDGDKPQISWLQSLDEPALALPVISPELVMPEYNPIISEELLGQLGDVTDENVVILLTVTVPKDITLMTSNLKAPIIINSDTKKGCQAVADNADYMIKYPVYELLKRKAEQKGDI